jgi:hypothetical protein
MSAKPASASQASANKERRALPRFDGGRIAAYVRPKGRFNRLSVEVLDFNRHGAAIQVHQPLAREQLVFLTLKHGMTRLERIIGVVHNCMPTDSGFRCGIRFRTQSDLQFDKVQIDAQLADLEALLCDGRPGETV